MTVRETVRDLARDLPLGGSRSGLVCPKCGGGATGERSFSVTRYADGIGYLCHRVKCDLSGTRHEARGPTATVPAPFVPRPYLFNRGTPGLDSLIWPALRLSPQDASAAAALSARLGVFARLDNPDEIVWEVRDYDWNARGHLSRTYPGKIIRTWKELPGLWVGYHGQKRSPVLWVVEDMVGGARLALAGVNALALLGTNFSAEAKTELGRHLSRTFGDQPTRIIVALDPDASEKAAQMARELTFRLGRDTIFLPMDKDPKDLDPDDLRALVKEYSL